jgi:hypothetical protein
MRRRRGKMKATRARGLLVASRYNRECPELVDGPRVKALGIVWAINSLR